MTDRITAGYVTQNQYNIGNAFIDIGALEQIDSALDRAFEQYELVPVSDHSLLNSSIPTPLRKITNPLWRFVEDKVPRGIIDRLLERSLGGEHKFNLIEQYDFDFLFISGCVLTLPYFHIHRKLLENISESSTTLIFIGAGSNSYSNYEQKYLSKILSKIDTSLMISRDRTAYDYYGEFFDYTMDGIDSAFFVNKIEYSEPPMALDEYSVLTFDKYKSMEKEKKVMREVEKTYDIIQACHAPHPVRSFRSIEPRDEDFVSDLPEDYLRLYANAEEVHSDRIHACVPTIALGGRCMLHNESLRAPMFEKVTSGNITQQVVRKSGLEEVQREQVEFLADRLTDLDEK